MRSKTLPGILRPSLQKNKHVGILEDNIPIEKIPVVLFGTKGRKSRFL
jgi:hypothetical protein